MFAVIKTGGKQYRVQEGDVLLVEKLGLEEGKKVTFNQILLIDDEKNTLIGNPFLENALVKGEIIENFKDKKVIIFKKKRRKQYRRTRGHRQELTRIRIEEIVSDLKAVPKKKPAKPDKKAEVEKAPQEIKVKREMKPKGMKEEKPIKPEKAKAKGAESEAKKKIRAAKTEESKVKASTGKKATAKKAPQVKKSKKMKEK